MLFSSSSPSMPSFLKTSPFTSPLPLIATSFNYIPLKSPKPFCLSFNNTTITNVSPTLSLHRFVNLVPFASNGDPEITDTQEVVEEQPEIEDSSDAAVGVEDGASSEEVTDTEETPSIILALLQSYKEALANNDETRVTEIEGLLKSIEDEKIDLEKKVASLTEELSSEKDRILRISADFDNFRKRTERERLSLVTNAQGEIVENLLPVLDNFERAKTQIKVETEGEEKVHNSYQSIYKQFKEILGVLGVVPVDTVGKPFDPMLHEAIMREESTEFEDGIILEEFRRGFKLGDRLLRPSMVKVSAGPGPAKAQEGSKEKEESKPQNEPSEEAGTASEASEEGEKDTESTA